MLKPAKYLLLLLVILMGVNAHAQKVTGLVVDKTTKQPIAGASVNIEGFTTRTNQLGQFEVDVPHAADSLKITALGYKSLIVATGKPSVLLRIELESKINNLNEVTVRGDRSFKKDSFANRADFANQFNYTGPKVMEAFTGNLNKGPGELISINPLILIEALTKKSSPEYKFKQKLIRDEHEQFVDEHFNRGIVVRLTSMKGDTLSEFLTRFRPDFLFTQKATGYDMEVYIRDCFKKFEKEGFPVSKPFYEVGNIKKGDLSLK